MIKVRGREREREGSREIKREQEGMGGSGKEWEG